MPILSDKANRDGRLRSGGLLLPEQALFQAELHPEMGSICFTAAAPTVPNARVRSRVLEAYSSGSRKSRKEPPFASVQS